MKTGGRIAHSYRKLSTGLRVTARRVWVLTESRVTSNIATPGRANNHQQRSRLQQRAEGGRPVSHVVERGQGKSADHQGCSSGQFMDTFVDRIERNPGWFSDPGFTATTPSIDSRGSGISENNSWMFFLILKR
jgi:hypothetical protein